MIESPYTDEEFAKFQKTAEYGIELKLMTDTLTHFVLGAFAPASTRWHRNYTELAEWYWICQINPGTKLV